MWIACKKSVTTGRALRCDGPVVTADCVAIRVWLSDTECCNDRLLRCDCNSRARVGRTRRRNGRKIITRRERTVWLYRLLNRTVDREEGIGRGASHSRLRGESRIARVIESESDRHPPKKMHRNYP